MKLALALVVSLFIAGCASSGTQVSQNAAMQFKEGVTTEAQIVAKLGPPSGISISSGGIKTLSYTGAQYQTKAASFIPIVGLFAGGADYTISTAAYQLGTDGILQKIDYSTYNGSTGMGSLPAPMNASSPTAVK